MRTGAIESLTQRLTTLEQMFIGQGVLLRPILERALNDRRFDASSANGSDTQSIAEQCSRVKSTLISASYDEPTSTSGLAEPVPKRSRNLTTKESAREDGLDPALPPWDVVLDLVEYYFKHIHPWMPILHVRQFRRQLHDELQRRKIKVILQAILSLCLRFDESTFTTCTEKRTLCLQYRHAVILQSMEKFSVENLQAMIIVAFDIIGSGRGPSAWSLVGSMARTVEQLQLSVEDMDHDDQDEARTQNLLIGRMSFLQPPQTWIESEGRRRVFWNVFLMDRFCSVATGWNNSLTSADVRRRLPCEGAIWEEGIPVRTPYFGIAERSNISTEQTSTPNSERRVANDDEIDSLGGFAFCVEATESLNLVTTFFLRQPVDFSQAQQIQVWLMHFKELDLRLVKWRVFLPKRWGNASVLNEQGVMDPNLTLAHITHNTAVIQLHQFMAYPSSQLRTCPIALPSASSSETCITAATEISNIARQYLSMSAGITNPQFAFCLFVAGRVLLANSAYGKTELHPIFDEIILSLSQIAKRWAGSESEATNEGKESLAYRFVVRLKRAKDTIGELSTGNARVALNLHQPVYSGDDDDNGGDVDQEIAPTTNVVQAVPIVEDRFDMTGAVFETSPSSFSMAYSAFPHSFETGNHLSEDFFAQPEASSVFSNQLGPEAGVLNQASAFREGELDSLMGLFDQPFQEVDTLIPSHIS
ncbi:hypothetical protein MBLNU459_g4837t1 [Dothideomycetes sp. NU459]